MREPPTAEEVADSTGAELELLKRAREAAAGRVSGSEETYDEPRFDGIVSDVIYESIGKGIDAVRCDECGSNIILTDRSDMTTLDEQTDENGLILACNCQLHPFDDATALSTKDSA